MKAILAPNLQKGGIYILVENNEKIWPQNDEAILAYSQITKRYEFSVSVGIGQDSDIGETFMIGVVLVDDQVHQRFQSWFEQGEITGLWPGIPKSELDQVGDLHIIDKVDVKRILR